MTTTLQMKRRTPSLGSLPNVAGMSIVEGPTPSNLNKPPTSASSLYHTCRSVLDRLACVPGFEYYLETEFQLQNSNSSESTSSTPSDPLTKLWQICRQGLSLCLLFNTLRPDKLIKLDDISGPNNGQSAKKAVYRFIVACKEELRTSDDELFTITELNQNDTNGFVKVVKTVSTILDRLEEKGIITVRSSNRNSDPNAPKNTRDKVVMELLETERKYVADMERLQNYMRELQNQNILPPDTIHYLFANLNNLVDFQRRFLISVEANADAPSQEQRWGQLFQSQEEAFTVYEPFCANYNQAQDLAIQENLQLQKLASMIEPSYELPSLLIKPVQRICKYPLLLGELIKSTDKEWKYYDELVAGREAVQRVTMRVNEVQRKLENAQAVEELKRRVEDWKGYAVDSFGALLLQEKFLMSSNDAERELHVFLFERILLICKEIKDANRKLSNKGNSIKKKKRASLQLKGKIFITSIIQVMNNGRNGVWSLKVFWRDSEMESFSLKCRNEEQLKLWESTLNKLLKDSQNPSSNGNATQMPPRRNVSNTTMGSLASFNIAPRVYHDDDDAASFIESGEEEEEEEEEDNYDEEEEYDGGWSGAKQRSNSLHALANNGHGQPVRQRPRTQGDSEYSSSSHHRTATPPMPNGPSRSHPVGFPGGMSLPPLPRTNSSSSTTISTATDYGFYPASPPPSNPSSPTTSARASTSSSGSNQVWARNEQQSSPLSDTVLKYMMTPEGATTPTEEYRQYPPAPTRTHSQSLASQANMGHPMYQNGQQPPLPNAAQTRLRSQSSPNIHRHNGHGHGHSGMAPWEPTPEVPRNNGYIPTGGPAPTEASVSASRYSNGSNMREQFTVRPSGSNPQLNSTAMQQDGKAGSTTAPNSPGSIKLKLNFFDGIYVIVVPQEVEYQDLMEKVEKKIRLCGDPRATAGLLRIKYQDEDGDMITINSDDDVQMAFEARGGGNTVNLFVN
ncbi:hypothetical protein BC936DRAFT_149684 [Jimgerdemannia flammicorona]|uniref:CDC24 calponin n=1 Tax=Jimgerdemannia flammicorona TaxID=994334 RepID=A0A433D0C2_9FUNG|nr:hypothetical protein BC936DRAFT_149684 [Jimgerdemannia flammicorona]